MKKVHITSVEDLTEENLTLFDYSLNEIRRQNARNKTLLENRNVPNFDSLESYMKYYDAVPFEDFDRKFRGEE